MEVEIKEDRPKHEFTPKVADVFCRWIERSYKKIKTSYEDNESSYDEDFESIYRLYYPSKPFFIEIEWDLEEGESQLTLGFGKDSIVDQIEHLFCKDRTIQSIQEWIKYKIGTVRSFCICGDIITTNDNACDYCYIFSAVHDEPCIICYEKDGRWTKLLCNCVNGRIIHLHCWKKMSTNPRCPCCRKLDPDQEDDPDFD